eukprot:scaffold150065_cov31-Prasinocladus_malaysianus.AAC.1
MMMTIRMITCTSITTHQICTPNAHGSDLFQSQGKHDHWCADRLRVWLTEVVEDGLPGQLVWEGLVAGLEGFEGPGRLVSYQLSPKPRHVHRGHQCRLKCEMTTALMPAPTSPTTTELTSPDNLELSIEQSCCCAVRQFVTDKIFCTATQES